MLGMYSEAIEKRIAWLRWLEADRGIPLAGVGWHEAGNGHTEFVCFQDRGASFGAWSYFHLRDGYKLAEKIADFEKAAGTAQDAAEYIKPDDSTRERYDHPLHEVRWLYAALHLMSERLTVQVLHPTSRAVRRRLERQREQVPEFVKVVTLRRLQQARERDGASADVNWKWQWTVRGHWRNQFYPNEGIHKPKFIDAYFKGPEDKPLKPDTLKLFVAKR